MTLQVGSGQVDIQRKPKRSISMLRKISGPAIALLLSLAITALIISLTGKDPLLAFESMFTGAFGTMNSLGETLIKTVPLMLAGLGLTICYRTGLTSIGAEGQIVMGGLMATLVGVYLGNLPSYILIPLAFLAAMIAGGIWAGIAGYLKAKLGVSEVINTIMLNYIATFFISYLVDGPLREPPGFYPQSSLLSENAWLSYLIKGTRMHTGVIVAVIAAIVVYILLWKLPLGYQMRTVGYNPIAARTNGINVSRNMVLAMFLSGVFAGLAGAIEIMGLHHRLMNGFSSSYGFDAMAVALLGRLHPVGVMIASLLFAAMRVGANTMQRVVQVPVALVNVMQGVVIVMVLMETVLRNFRISFKKPKAACDTATPAAGKEA
ncbi:MAG: ABC transporter permease [Bacillota bacterium]